MMIDPNKGQDIREKVREGYAAVALQSEKGNGGSSGAASGGSGGSGGGDGGCGCGPGCCAPGAPDVSGRLGYDASELEAIPEGADMGLSCGNPTVLASLEPGEWVLDLGSGGGLDVFLAGMKVGGGGGGGRAIGVDMTPEMLSKSRAGIASYTERTGLANVEFRLGEIEHLPVADASIDVVISNCVINLSPDKPRVWREIGRVLKPGGRVAVSDLVVLKPLPAPVQEMIESWIGCISGASLVDEVRAMAEAAGLDEVAIELKHDYMSALDHVQDPLYRRIVSHLPAGETLASYVTSANITATRPRGN